MFVSSRSKIVMCNTALAKGLNKIIEFDEDAVKAADDEFYRNNPGASKPLWVPAKDGDEPTGEDVEKWVNTYVNEIKKKKPVIIAAPPKTTKPMPNAPLRDIVDLGDSNRPQQLQMILYDMSSKDLGSLDNSLHYRLGLMKDCLVKAYKQRKDDAFVIFVAPENYFMKYNTPNSRYTEEEFATIWTDLCKFSHHLPNMLIVPGSIVWFQPALQGTDKLRIHNTAPVIWNEKCFLYHKKWDNDLKDISKEVFDIPPGMHGVFRVSGMTMGIAICSDSHCLRQDCEMLPGKPKLDVHILIAMGQELRVDECASKIGGYGIQVDACSSARLFDFQTDGGIGKLVPRTPSSTVSGSIIIYQPVNCPPE
jgi:hypothetical protein